MRRRLTVTGASQNIDGVVKPGAAESGELKKYKGKKQDKVRDFCFVVECIPEKQIAYQHLLSVFQAAETVRCAVTEYSGVSKKGHAPYNPRKKNQDALIMADDPNTNSLILCVMDGHGEHGDYVSAWFRDQLISEMFNHPAWNDNLQAAVAEAIAKVERDLLRNFRIDTEFSGTTLSMAIIRGNQLTGVNIGDSRVILGRE
jgi:hypothetical protein